MINYIFLAALGTFVGALLYFYSPILVSQKPLTPFHISGIFFSLCTGLLFTATHYFMPYNTVSYLFFFSLLLISFLTDARYMLISRFVSIYIVPVFFLAAYIKTLPISLFQSICGAVSAYLFLSCIFYLYLKWSGREGLGWGDVELLTLIGTFLGISGWWFTLYSGATIGMCYGLISSYYHNTPLHSTKLPFGPFLIIGAIGTSFAMQTMFATYQFNICHF